MAKGTWIALGVVAAILLVALGVVGSAVGTYNKLVDESVAIDAQAKQIDVQYQRKFDVIPDLVALTEQYFQNETEVQARVAALRTGLQAAESGDLNDKEEYAAEVDATRAIIVDVVNERYPELRGVELYRDTMVEIVNTANKIATEKVRYNDDVETYNAHIRQCCLPLLVANMMGFEEREFIGYSDRPNQSEFPQGEPL